jgi:hypothetical protein
VPAPTAGDGSCKDTYGYCSSYVSSGYCSTYFCDTCYYPDYCDKSCGYCESDDDTPPAPAPTEDPTCHDTYGYCSSYVSSGYCPVYFCDTCAYSDYCDKSCGYCEGDDDTPPAPAPVPAPVPAPTPQPTIADDSSCKDTYNYCSSYVTNGYCPTYFCDTCGYPNYCDKSCGYCESDDDTPPAPAPTQDPTCHDSYAYCSSYVNGGYCPTYFCDTCAYSDYCDKSCGYCDDDTPAPVPTAQPPTTSNDDDDGGGRTCFSGQETVLKENGQKVTFNKLVIGDMILSANRDGKTSYSPVVFLPHGENDTPTTFLEIVTSKMKKLKMTRGHLIQLCSGKLVSAQHLSMKPTILISKKDKDDYNCIRTVDGNEKIKDIRIVQSKGVYTAVTESEFLVVNGIIASPFAASSGLVHAYFNLTDIEEWCSSNNWLVYERLRHPQLINIHNKKKKTGLEKEEGEEQSQELVSPSMDCMDMLTNMFEQYKNEPIGWGKDGWGYKGWANPASLHKNMNEHLNTNDEVLLKGAQLLPPPLASPETLKKHAMPELITGWDLKEGEYMPNEEMV